MKQVAKVVVYTKTNLDELDKSIGSVKTERYSYHLTNEDGQVRVISVGRESLYY